MAERVDVVVLGTGLASLCLTRLLLLEHPGIRIATVDVAEGPSRKVGESTVEIGAHFFHTRLQLAERLRDTQLPKNGLRFWFDDEANSLPLHEASEDGPITFSYWQSYQLDREELERMLLGLNREAGAVHRFGAGDVRVEAIDAEAGHRVAFVHDGRQTEVVGRWFVDASGFTSRWGRSVGLLEPEPRVPRGACWGRFRGFRSPDSLLEERHARRHVVGRRLLSTNHLMNEGYWIWWIPLRNGLTSIGLVYDSSVLERPPRNQDEFVSFLRRHRMCADLMEDAEPVDYGQLRNFAWKPRHYFAPDRTAAIGMAGGFLDPFYSGGSDFIAIECDCLSRLIAAERAAGVVDADQVEIYNDMLRAYYEQTVQFVDDTYKTFVSYELSAPRYRRDLHAYWGLWTWPYFSRELFDPAFLRRFLPVVAIALERGAFFNRLLRGAYDELARRGQLRRRNRGAYGFNQLGYGLVPFVRFERQMGHPLDLDRALRLLDEIDTASFLAIADVLFDGHRSPLRKLLFDAVRGDALADIMAAERELGVGEAFWAAAFRRFEQGLRDTLARHGTVCEPMDLAPQDLAHLHGSLLESGADESIIEREWRALPVLETVALSGARDRVQPPTRWTLEHTAWPLGTVDMSTVYDWMTKRPDSEITRLYL